VTGVFWIAWLHLLTPYTQYWGLQAITALSLIYTLYSSPLHTTLGSQSSLVVSRQRIYNSLTATSNLTWRLLFTAYFLLAIILQLPIPKTWLNSIPLLPSSYPGRLASRNSTQFFSTELFFIIALHGPRRKHTRPLYPRKRAPSTHYIGGWEDPRAGLDDMQKWKFFTLPGLEAVASRYTDYSILAPKNIFMFLRI
jgi:hypothetical protein